MYILTNDIEKMDTPINMGNTEGKTDEKDLNQNVPKDVQENKVTDVNKNFTKEENKTADDNVGIKIVEGQSDSERDNNTLCIIEDSDSCMTKDLHDVIESSVDCISKENVSVKNNNMADVTGNSFKDHSVNHDKKEEQSDTKTQDKHMEFEQKIILESSKDILNVHESEDSNCNIACLEISDKVCDILKDTDTSESDQKEMSEPVSTQNTENNNTVSNIQENLINNSKEFCSADSKTCSEESHECNTSEDMKVIKEIISEVLANALKLTEISNSDCGVTFATELTESTDSENLRTSEEISSEENPNCTKSVEYDRKVQDGDKSPCSDESLTERDTKTEPGSSHTGNQTVDSEHNEGKQEQSEQTTNSVETIVTMEQEDDELRIHEIADKTNDELSEISNEKVGEIEQKVEDKEEETQVSENSERLIQSQEVMRDEKIVKKEQTADKATDGATGHVIDQLSKNNEKAECEKGTSSLLIENEDKLSEDGVAKGTAIMTKTEKNETDDLERTEPKSNEQDINTVEAEDLFVVIRNEENGTIDKICDENFALPSDTNIFDTSVEKDETKATENSATECVNSAVTITDKSLEHSMDHTETNETEIGKEEVLTVKTNVSDESMDCNNIPVEKPEEEVVPLSCEASDQFMQSIQTDSETTTAGDDISNVATQTSGKSDETSDTTSETVEKPKESTALTTTTLDQSVDTNDREMSTTMTQTHEKDISVIATQTSYEPLQTNDKETETNLLIVEETKTLSTSMQTVEQSVEKHDKETATTMTETKEKEISAIVNQTDKSTEMNVQEYGIVAIQDLNEERERDDKSQAKFVEVSDNSMKCEDGEDKDPQSDDFDIPKDVEDTGAVTGEHLDGGTQTETLDVTCMMTQTEPLKTNQEIKLKQEFDMLKDQLGEAKKMIQGLQSELACQQIRSTNTISTLKIQLKKSQELNKAQRIQADRQIGEVLAHLLFLEGQLKKDQMHIKHVLKQKDDIILQQNVDIETLKGTNQRLIEAVREHYARKGRNGLSKEHNEQLQGADAVVPCSPKVKSKNKGAFGSVKDKLWKHRSSLDLSEAGTEFQGNLKKDRQYSSQENLFSLGKKNREARENRDKKCKSIAGYPDHSLEYLIPEESELRGESLHGSDSSLSSPNKSVRNVSWGSDSSDVNGYLDDQGQFLSVSPSSHLMSAGSMPILTKQNSNSDFIAKERPHSISSIESLSKSSENCSISPNNHKAEDTTKGNNSIQQQESSNPFKNLKTILKRKGSKMKNKKRSVSLSQNGNQEYEEAMKKHFEKYGMS